MSKTVVRETAINRKDKLLDSQANRKKYINTKYVDALEKI